MLLITCFDLPKGAEYRALSSRYKDRTMYLDQLFDIDLDEQTVELNPDIERQIRQIFVQAMYAYRESSPKNYVNRLTLRHSSWYKQMYKEYSTADIDTQT